MAGLCRRLLIALTFAATPCLAIGPAVAAEADAERIEERLPTEPKPPTDGAPAPPPEVEANYASFQPFELKAIAVEGMTAAPRGEAEACGRPFIGKTVGPIELISLTQCVTRIYRDRDLFLSRAVIPPQEIVDGVLKLRVIEGYIFAVAPTGIDQADADAQFAKSLSERPATLPAFERALMLLTDRYGHRVTGSQLAADPNDPARYTLRLAVELKPVTWRIYGDNRGTEGHGPEQAFASVAWNSLFGAPDRIAVSLFTSPTDVHELLYADVNYAHSWARGLLWTELGASVSRSRDGSVDPIVADSNDANRVYGRMSTPILRSRSQSLWVDVSADARDVEQRNLPFAHVDESTRVLRGSLSYTLSKGAARQDIRVEVSRGLDALGASSNGETNLTRADARPQFTKVRIDATTRVKFLEQWEAVVAAAGQLADGALVSSEEFGGGGARFGRAYDYAEIIGDHGWAASAELRWNWKNPTAFMSNLQLYAFADAVSIWNAGGTPSDVSQADLSSAGIGVRLTPRQGVTATIEGAEPLSRDVASEGDRSARVFVALSMGW